MDEEKRNAIQAVIDAADKAVKLNEELMKKHGIDFLLLSQFRLYDGGIHVDDVRTLGLPVEKSPFGGGTLTMRGTVDFNGHKLFSVW